MANEGKYVAYVSTYTQKDKYGIHIFDVDMKNGYLTLKDRVQLTNSSYVTISHSRKYLYAITDFGVRAYKILEDGLLEEMNQASINGMRGCYLSTDYTDRFLFVAGYHDGKITALRLNEDGSVGEIVDEVYQRGLGTVAERNLQPHVTCVKMTRDNKYLLAADLGMDHTNVYMLNPDSGKLKMVDVIRSDINSSPRRVKITPDGKHVYIVHESKSCIDVYTYEEVASGNPEFERIQTISTTNSYHAGGSNASALNFSTDYKYLVSSNFGDNSVIVLEVKKDGTLEKHMCLPISGEYPKDAAMFPDNKHLVSLNHESDTMTFFTVDMKKNTMVMHGKEIKIERPNCIIFHKLG